MTLTLFEKYEIRRKKYFPGTRWKTKSGTTTIIELVILPRDTPNIQVYSAWDEIDDSEERLIKFRIVKSEARLAHYLTSGNSLSWSEQYMEAYYEPIFE